jgi:hypothetical protein
MFIYLKEHLKIKFQYSILLLIVFLFYYFLEDVFILKELEELKKNMNYSLILGLIFPKYLCFVLS